jgi:hypothetical protein
MNRLDQLSGAQKNTLEDYFQTDLASLDAEEPEFGHMAYLRQVITAPDGRQAFAKIVLPGNYHDDDSGTAADYAARDHELLEHEAKSLDLVNQASNDLAPRLLLFCEGVMLTEYLAHRRWLAPGASDISRYARDVLSTLDGLQNLPVAGQLHRETVDNLMARNWAEVDFSRIPFPEAEPLVNFREIGEKAIKNLVSVAPTHHDAHQNNIGWNSSSGARLIDFSWFDLGPENADQTSFLIDLAASGHDVTPWLDDHFNESYAWLRTGNWLYRSGLPPSGPDGLATRRTQFGSAVAALKLLQMV